MSLSIDQEILKWSDDYLISYQEEGDDDDDDDNREREREEEEEETWRGRWGLTNRGRTEANPHEWKLWLQAESERGAAICSN